MTATYDDTKLSITAPDFNTVRFLLGDTDVTSAQLQDEEITFALDVRGNIYGATAMCAQALAAKYARLVNISADSVSVAYSQKSKQFQDLAAEYQGKEATVYCAPYAGGISQSDMRNILADTDRVPNIFRFGISDNPPSDGVDPSPGTADIVDTIDDETIL